jgi:hypothetical protein
MTAPSRTLSIAIAAPVGVVAAFLAEPTNFPLWASGLSGSLEVAPDAVAPGAAPEWLANGPAGNVRIRFSPPNPLGVADHWVILAQNITVYVPLRAVANGDGTEVMLTLFRQADMDDARFDADCEWVLRDLATLKRVIERSA